MKPTVVVAGIPWYSMGNRAPAVKTWFEAKTHDWNPVLIWNQSDRVSLNNCWDRVEQILDNIEQEEQGEGTHLLLFHKDIDTRQQYFDRVRPFHRIRFLSSKLLQKFSSASMQNVLDTELEIEMEWRRRIRPADLKHPLIIPHEYFSTSTFFHRLWPRSQDAETLNDIAAIADGLADFSEAHANREGYGGQLAAYRDDNDLFFKFPPARDYHGDPGEDVVNNWKYTFWIEKGFHYDVGPKSGRGSFELVGPSGSTAHVDNVNVYPHGKVRG